MFDTLLPQCIDQAYRGHKLALWLFGLVVSMKTTQSLFIFFNGYSTVISADGIPLDTYPPAAAQNVVALFTLYSLSRLFLMLLCVLALVRYRRAIPFMFALLALNYLAAQLVLRFVPMNRTGTPPASIVNLVLFALMILGLALSLRPPLRALDAPQ
jgi:hypothetical protein